MGCIDCSASNKEEDNKKEVYYSFSQLSNPINRIDIGSDSIFGGIVLSSFVII